MRFSHVICAVACGLWRAHGITVIPGGEPKPFDGVGRIHSAVEFWKLTVPNVLGNSSAQILMSSYLDDAYFDNDFAILASSDSFTRGAIQAWGQHMHLVISPDAVWLTILSQMVFWMGAHAEEARPLYDFGSEAIVNITDYPDWYSMIAGFFRGVEARSNADWVHGWINPSFNTTNQNEEMAANIMAMGLAKGVAPIEEATLCGLPSVTLLGLQEDWEKILARLDRLPLWGEEPGRYMARLKPIISRFVASWKEPDSTATKAFWNQMVMADKDAACGGFNVSGWITGFYFWDTEGQPYGRENGGLVMDNTSYPSLNIRTLPVGYSRAPFSVSPFNDTAEYQAYAIGGALGKRVDPGAPEDYLPALERMGLSNSSYNASHHSTMTPLVSFAFYGPFSHNISVSRPIWLAEPEITILESAVQSNYNETCSVKMRHPSR